MALALSDKAASEHHVTSIGQCPVCSARISDPKQLSCSHIFCEKCLTNMLSCSSKLTTLECPLSDCGKTTIVTDGDLVNLKTNFPLKALIEDVRKRQQLCKMCDANTEATHFCRECVKNMCDVHLQKHNEWSPNNNHRIDSVEDIREGRVVIEKEVFCQEHKDLCTHVCLTCMKLVCTRYWKIDHENKGHTIQDLKEYKSSSKSQIEAQKARGDIKATTIKNHQKYIEVQKKRVDDQIDGTIVKIDHIRLESINTINQRGAALSKQLETQRSKFHKRLDDMVVADEKSVKNIESASVLAVDSLNAPLEKDAIKIRGSLSEGLGKVLKQKNPNDKLATDVGDRAEQLMFQQNSECDQLGIGEVRFQTCILECEVKFLENGMTDMTATPDGRMAIAYSRGEIHFYSAEGKLQEKVSIGVSVSKVAFLSDGSYVVCDASNTTTLYTSEQRRLGVVFVTLGQEDGFSDLTVDRNDMIYISYSKAKKILVFSPEGGRATREIPCIRYNPHHITSHNDWVIVSGMNKVRMVNRDGQVKHFSEKSGSRPYAAVTQNNSVLVAWVKDNERLISIDEYTNKLSHIRNVISDHRIEKPALSYYYLHFFPSGEIAFCTSEKLYIFN